MTTSPLRHIVCSTADPDAAKQVLGHVLGLPADAECERIGAIGFVCGAVRIVFLPRGDDRLERPGETGVDHLAFAAVSPAALDGLAPVECAGLFGGRALRCPRDATAGVAVRFESETGDGAGASPLIERIDHIGIASADNEDGLSVFCSRLEFPLESNQFDAEFRVSLETFTSDRYGIVQHARPAERVGGLRVSFVTVADCELEFLQDLDPGTAVEGETSVAGTTKRDQSAIGRFLTRNGPGLHHLAFKTPDIDAALTRLSEAGVATIDHVGRPGSRRARIGFLHPKALGGVLMHLVERTPLDPE